VGAFGTIRDLFLPPGRHGRTFDQEISMKIVAAAVLGVAGLAFAGVAAAQAKGAPGKGEDTYNKACASCHAQGVAGAPKLGDKAAWAPRIK
jgi:cytochrome c5